MTSSAASSSLTAIVPISAATALPTVALRIVAVMKGPISRAMLTATMMPIWSCWPMRESSMPVWRATIMPMKSPTSRITCRTPTPPLYMW